MEPLFWCKGGFLLARGWVYESSERKAAQGSARSCNTCVIVVVATCEVQDGFEEPLLPGIDPFSG